MLGIVIDGLFGDSQFCCCGEGFAGAWVAHKAGMGTAGDLQANVLARAEVVGSGPDVYLEMQATIGFGIDTIGSQAYDAIAQVDGFTGWLNDTETGEEVGVLQAGANVEIGRDGADDLHIMIEDGAGVDQDIGSSFQFAVVSCSHMLSEAERVSTDGRGWIRGIIAIVIWLRCGWRRKRKCAMRLVVPALVLCWWRPVGEVAPLICSHHE